MIRLENGLERKKIIYFLLREEVGVLQGELTIKQRADRWKKYSKCGIAHLT